MIPAASRSREPRRHDDETDHAIHNAVVRPGNGVRNNGALVGLASQMVTTNHGPATPDGGIDG
ncbi:hypothetical protein LC1Hm_1355 [Halomicrobium sp. LC1Hm]|nr:hypothetical protein LC1Hm_1355 [Halomicrobium sp. LC1Hm]